jgi:hypothetical protein
MRERWLDNIENNLKEDEDERMDKEDEQRAVETGCKGGQGSPRAVAPSGR